MLLLHSAFPRTGEPGAPLRLTALRHRILTGSRLIDRLLLISPRKTRRFPVLLRNTCQYRPRQPKAAVTVDGEVPDIR
jgi:hypothetical protein